MAGEGGYEVARTDEGPDVFVEQVVPSATE
jgi:hypothetical protein